MLKRSVNSVFQNKCHILYTDDDYKRKQRREERIMEDVKKVVEALELVERYEYYLFRKAWGKMLLIIGTMFPLGSLLVLNAQIVASFLGIPVDAVGIISALITIVASIALTAIAFSSAHSSRPKTQKSESAREWVHGIIIAIIWFIAFSLTSYSPPALYSVSALLASGFSCLCSYLILRYTPEHTASIEILFLGFMLLAASVPIFLMGETQLALYTALLFFSLSFIITGIYILSTSAKHLTVSASV
jgi:hypothetical protein